MRQNVFIIGATGKVGRELSSQIALNDGPRSGKHENPTIIVGLADSRHYAINPGGFSEEILERFSATRARVAELQNAEPLGLAGIITISDRMARIGYGEDIVYVDATGMKLNGKALHVKIIGETQARIVTANKNPIGLYDFSTYRKLTGDPTRYKYSATTMAGLGAVPWLSERHILQDRIRHIQASLSGTVGFITDALTQGKKLSDAIREAQNKGYTEPDWRDDLNGIDVARKLTILAREAGYAVDFEHIVVEPFLPEKYLFIEDPETCLQKIEKELDAEMAARYAEAARRGMTLKYIASLEEKNGGIIMTVGLREVPKDGAFGKLNGTANRIEVVTDMYTAEKPYMLEGPGAGLDITASVLRRDLLHLQPRIKRF